MARRIVNPNRFILLGAVTDWTAVYRRKEQRWPNPRDLAKQRKLASTRTAQLRWLVDPGLGYPTAPFEVWRRPALPMDIEQDIPLSLQADFFTLRVVGFDQPRVFVHARFNVSGGGAVIAYAGAPFASAVVAVKALTDGANDVTFSGPSIQSMAFSSAANLVTITGIDHAIVDDKSWQPVERVALPVDPSWAGVYDLGGLQGPEGGLMEPPKAALDRFRRGAPFYGWDDQLESGIPAPPWKLANAKAMVEVVQHDMLESLRHMIESLPPDRHATFEEVRELPLSGVGDPATTRFRPMSTLVFAAATDPLASLITGFGTAFEDIDLPPTQRRDHTYLDDPDRSDWDFMVTARYGKGTDGSSEEIEYAAIVHAPFVASGPPVPANLAAQTDGNHSPPSVDDPWRGVVRVAWDKIADTLPFRVGSYAFARAQQAPAGGVEALMDRRQGDDALQPISATTSMKREHDLGRLSALDERYTIASVPASNVVRYGVAHQDLFGLWSAWATVGHTISEPAPQKLTILSARLEPTAASTGPCPASLVIDFSWDWASRSLGRAELVGRLYPQARRNDPPADTSLPAGLPRSLTGGVGVPLRITFNGGAVGVPDSGALQYLSEDGKSFLSTPPGNAGMRRYRLTVPGFQLDFGAAGHLGLALWAHGIENRAPGREGPWSTAPSVASASDPRPPLINVTTELVNLASMPDAAGEHHARLEWPAAPGAVGYFVYTTTESKLRVDHGMTEALASHTLAQRLAELRDAFAASPARRSFTRLTDKPITQTFSQLTLPRGSKEIHLYMVLAVSAGQVESPWPTLADPSRRLRPFAFAAPQVATPAPPDLEVARVLDTSVSPPVYRPRLRVRTKPGAPVARVDLYRVRVPEAALALDTMGPAVARITGTSAPWLVTATPDTGPGTSQPLGTIAGLDGVDGSWKRVFYRAVAWAADAPTRGLYGGRSQPSAVREVIVPPSTPPDLSTLTATWPGAAVTEMLIAGTSLAPIDDTALGPHRLRIEALVERVDGSSQSVFRYPATAAADNRLAAIPTAAIPVGASGVWREPGGAPGLSNLQLRVQRGAIAERLKVRFVLTDPLGRVTERSIDVPPTELAAPDIVSPTVTRVAGKGFTLSFETTVPVVNTAFGPYLLEVRYTPTGGSQVPTSSPLPPIRATRPGEDLFTDPAAIPLRRARGALGRNQISMALRGVAGGRVELILRCPDGRTATLTRVFS